MSKTFDVLLSQVKFPNSCVVCLTPAARQYPLEKTFSMGRRSYTVKVGVPMCDSHFQTASFKGTAEKLIGTLAVIGGILTGFFAAIVLVVRWEGAGNIILKLFAGGIFGLGIFLIVWVVITLSVAPLFAEPESKEARGAVRITHYWPREQVVRLEFQNEQVAELVKQLN
jgi:hypothetical protein